MRERENTHIGPHPHQGGCEGCRKAAQCNVCGGPAGSAQRCTNGRCATCHVVVCTPGGLTGPGHGHGSRAAAERQWARMAARE